MIYNDFHPTGMVVSLFRNTGSHSTEVWLSKSGQVAQIEPEYSTGSRSPNIVQKVYSHCTYILPQLQSGKQCNCIYLSPFRLLCRLTNPLIIFNRIEQLHPHNMSAKEKADSRNRKSAQFKYIHFSSFTFLFPI